MIRESAEPEISESDASDSASEEDALEAPQANRYISNICFNFWCGQNNSCSLLLGLWTYLFLGQSRFLRTSPAKALPASLWAINHLVNCLLQVALEIGHELLLLWQQFAVFWQTMYWLFFSQVLKKRTSTGLWLMRLHWSLSGDFFCATIGHGIVNYRQKRDAYVHKNSSLSGLLGNDLLRFLHSLEQWKRAKKLWTLPRDTLTEYFNMSCGYHVSKLCTHKYLKYLWYSLGVFHLW